MENQVSPNIKKKKRTGPDLSKTKIIEFLNLQDHSAHANTAVPIGEPLFRPTPSQITFDKYEPFAIHQAKLCLRNNDTVARRIRVEPPDSPFFEISAPRSTSRKQQLKDGRVAAGMEICYIVTFRPQERKEYSYDLVCCTEREKFVVPIRGSGTLAVLNFPEKFDFGSCPVKQTTTNVISVQNIGSKGSKFRLRASPPFNVSPRSVFVDEQSATQIQISFKPSHARAHESILAVEDDCGNISQVILEGYGQNIDIYLGQPIVEPDPAYISLSSQKTVKVYNCSDHPVKFSWKAFSNKESEELEKVRLENELTEMEARELGQLDCLEYSDEGSDGSLSDNEGIPSSKRDEISAIRRKYRNLRKAVEDDEMQFADDCFRVEPSTGEIWANSEIEVTITFSPNMAASYACSTFLDVTGREERLPLQLHGQGIGPKASLSFDVLDIGNQIYVNSVHKYQLELTNEGDIPAHYELVDSKSTFGSKFQFVPSSGVLEVGQTQDLDITFCSDTLGEFSEHFKFNLKGSDEPLCVHFKGHVIGPKFDFNVDQIDFGTVSYGFSSERVVTLMNLSDIPMTYRLRVPQDGKYKRQEFKIQPSEGTIEPKNSQIIQIEFTSEKVMTYEYYLTVDIDGVGEELLSLPIRADCKVPHVNLQNPQVDFGSCFLRFPCSGSLTLVNECLDLPAKYEVVPQDEYSTVVASYSVESNVGVIPAGTKTEIDIKIVCEKLGNLRLPFYVKIIGSNDPPLMATLAASGKGPNVIPRVSSIEWGNCPCLVDSKKILRLENKSSIPAVFKTFIKSARSKFSVDIKEGIMKPNSSKEIEITANLDDTIMFKEQLHILVTEGENLLIPLSAKGIGTTMWSECDLKVIDFEHQFTNRECEWKCTLENKGRRSQVLNWTNTATQLLEAEAAKSKKGKSKKKDRTTKADEAQIAVASPVFSVHPATIELKPRTACTFTFYGKSTNPGPISEYLICETKVGQEKKVRTAFSTEIRAAFTNPMLQPSSPAVSFSYTYSPDVELRVQSKPLTLKNVAQLPLTFVLRAQMPFTLDTWECSLEPNQSITLNVDFDPGYKDDRTSDIIRKKLTAIYKDHPQRDTIDLIGEIWFPNVEFESRTVDFGCIFNDTNKSIVLKVKNTSKVNTAFHWVFMEDEQAARSAATGRKPYIPINQVFDILPIRSYLQPGETEDIEFVYYGHANRKFKGTVVCEVDGGPEYELSLLGEASAVAYRMDKSFLDFGPIQYDKVEERDFSIMNTSKVAFSYMINMESLKRPAMFSIFPLSGKIGANDRQKVTIKLKPGIPDYIVEVLLLEIAHFPPIEFKIYGRGIFASVGVNLPRENHPLCAIEKQPPVWRNLLREAKLSLLNPRSDLSPPEITPSESMTSLSPTRVNPRQGVTTSRVGPTATSRVTSRAAQGTSRTTARLTPQPSSTPEPIPQSDTRTASPHPKQVENILPENIDAEASRLFFMNYLLHHERVEERGEVIREAAADVEEKRGSIVPPLSLDTSSSTAKGSPEVQSKAQSSSTKESSSEDIEFVLSQYVLNFGNVVSGSNKQKKFKLKNTGKLPISFRIDKNAAFAVGFTIEPERVVRLPEGESVEFKVMFQARKHMKCGRVKMSMQLDLKTGPPIIVCLKANVTLPDVSLSAEMLDFGSIAVGRSRVICTQLQNTSPVVADWGIKKPMGSAKDLGYFKIDPPGGILQPNAKVNVSVEFLPREARQYHITLPLKVSSNPKGHNITFKGSGKEVSLTFDPPFANLGPILPYEASSVVEVSMFNNSDEPIEVYSLDFDTQYIEEESILREANGYDDDDIMRIPVRLPGECLPENIMAEHMEKVRLENPPTEDEEPDAASPDESQTEEIEMVETEDTEVVSSTQRQLGLAKDYVVIGPQLSGVSTQARMLADKLSLAVWTIDSAVELCAESMSELGTMTRQAIGLEPLTVATDGDENAPGTEVDEEPVEEQEATTVDIPLEMTPSLMTKIIRWRLDQPDAALGSVLDSFNSKYFGIEQCIEIVSDILSGATVISLGMASDAYELQLSEVKLRLEQEIEAENEVTPEPVEVKEVDIEVEDSVSISPMAADEAEVPEDCQDITQDETTEVIEPPVKIDRSAEIKKIEQALELESFDAYIDNHGHLLASIKKHFVDKEPKGAPVEPPVDPESENETDELAPAESLESPVHQADEADAPVEWIPGDIIEVAVESGENAEIVNKSISSAIEKKIRDRLNDQLQVLTPVTHQLLKRPMKRIPRRADSRFSIVLPSQEGSETPSRMRWIVPPKSSCCLELEFKSSDVGSFDCSLGFEIVGAPREYNLFCRGSCSVPKINTDPRNIFMNRSKNKSSGNIKKKYVIGQNMYVFGPLLARKDAEVRQTDPSSLEYQHASRTNSDIFRISNNGDFDALIDFSFAGNDANVFYIEPSSMELHTGETRDLIVWAFPLEPEEFQASLVCCIKDNPEAVVFPISCEGSLPDIELSGPWKEEEAAEESEETIEPVLNFDRLLLNRQEEKYFTIKNTCKIPVTWNIDTADIPSDFELSASDGILKPNEKMVLSVVFHSSTEANFDFVIKIKYSDTEGGMDHEERVNVLPLQIVAEAYRIDVCLFEASGDTEGTGMLDFGLKRVGEAEVRSFTLKNNGKYAVKFLIESKRQSTRHLFAIEPSSGVIEPEETCTIDVNFNSTEEILLRNNSDIRCTIMENETGEVHDGFSIITNVRSVFSQFRLQPQRGLSFGALRFNEEPRVKRFEIRNEGEFTFKFRVLKQDEAKVEPLTIESDVSAGTLDIGRFSMVPSGGSIEPGTMVPFEVKFVPDGEKCYKETIRIEISGRDPNNEQQSSSLIYEFTGESCFPGINTIDIESIFEEQAVIRSIDSNRDNQVYRNIYVEQEKKFMFGSVVCSTSQKGVIQRFRISNPNKIPANVEFTMKDNEPVDPPAFVVQPESWCIPPHEHRYVSVTFKPVAMKTYCALFSAAVEDGANASTNKLQFEVTGQGTLPCITVEKPISRNDEGVLELDFGRIRAQRKKKLPLVIRNDGIVPATVLFNMKTNKLFSFSGRNGSVTIPTGSSETLWVQFNPDDVTNEKTQCSLKLSVLHNQFDETIINMTGTAYREFVTFEELPQGSDDDLDFGDIDINATQRSKKMFYLKNHSNEPVRFSWAEHVAFSFSPSVGHLKPHSTRLIEGHFNAPEDSTSVQYNAEAVELLVQKIEYTKNDAEDETEIVTNDISWDNTMMSIRFEEDEGEDQHPVSEVAPEPQYGPIGDPATVFLKCSGSADVLKYSCPVENINFRPTYMFQTCVYEFSVENQSKTSLKYSWSFKALEAGRPVSATRRDNPFSISPNTGVVPGETSQTFVVRFSPTEVDDYRYSIFCETDQTLSEDLSPLRIALSGKSKRPICHIDLDESNYSQRRAADLPGPKGELGPLDLAVRVVEMESLGVRVRNTRRFYVVNPTNVSYEFQWQPVGNSNPTFRCATPKGLMLPGKKCEMVFEFTPQNVELQESFWHFTIPQHNLTEIFLFVGTTTEPNVVLDRGSVNFNTLLFGSKTTHTVYLLNHEHIPFNFSFDRATYDFSGQTGEKSALAIHPPTGVIAPNDQLAVEIEFAPNEERDYNFNLACTIKRKPTKLSLNVKGEGYAIHDCLTISDVAMGSATELQQVSLANTNHIDFGVVRVNEMATKNLAISNTGKVNFEFNWLGLKDNHVLTITPMSGTVRKNDRINCLLKFQPRQETSIDDIRLTCTTAGTRKYPFILSGSAVPPAVHFSFSSFDFGPCFITEPGVDPLSETALLRITNNDPETDFTIDCLYEKTSFLHIQCKPAVLSPGEVMEVPVVFTARNEQVYHEIIPFVVNTTTTVNVTMQGEGIYARLELANPSQQRIDFGVLQIGQSVARSVRMVNRSKREIRFHVQDENTKYDTYGVSISPSHEVCVKPKESIDVDVRFSPLYRVRPFNEQVRIVVEGCEKKLCVISGSCHGMEVELEADTLPFGPVCLGSQLTRKLQVMNYGDILAKYRWDTARFSPDFSVHPTEGILPPGTDKQFEVSFKPTQINDDIRYDKIPLFVEGMDNLCITLTGSCGPQPASSIKEITFDSRVRQEQVKQLVIENPTTAPWNLIPVIQGEHWCSKESLPVPAKGKAALDINYCPLRMTSSDDEENSVHRGTAFFALPDGTAILYNLLGTATEPEACDKISLSTPTKKHLSIPMKIKNWLKDAQRFSANIEAIDKSDSTFIEGADTVDVPAAGEREYTLKLYAYKEGTTVLRATFRNESTGEYLFYDISVQTTAAGVTDTLYFDAPVRQVVNKIITIENPFPSSTEIHFADGDDWWSCKSDTIRVTRLCELTGRPEGSFLIEYRPLLHVDETQEVNLTISCAELGDYKYTLKLSTSPPGIEKILHFTAPLGGQQTQTYRFDSYLRGSAAEFNCSVQQNTFFDVPKTVKADMCNSWDGVECSLQVKFEPEALGEIRDTLVVASQTAGEYKCSLVGVSTPPLPQGPFTFASSQDIPFRNVFNESYEFLFTTDNPHLIIAPKTQTIGAKSTKSVSIKRGNDSTETITGKMMVTCQSLPEMPPWVFYLECTK